MLALLSGGPQLVTKTFTASQSVAIPQGVSSLVSLIGKGQDGTAQTSYTKSDSAAGDSVRGYASGTGNSVGALTWADFQADIANVFNAVNAGGSGNGFVVNYDGYPNSGTYTASTYQYTFIDAVPGTASVFYLGNWKSSGPVLPSDYGYFGINYTRTMTVPATNGQSASGFGKTFAGGVAGPALTTTHANVPVTPGASYDVVVPSGGSITISYYQ